MQKITIYSDGGARGNPGNAGIGFLILDEQKKEIYQHGEYIGLATNNVAEYQAIKRALEHLLEQSVIAKKIECFLDSELVVKQLSGIYKIKKPHLAQIATSIHETIQNLKQKGLEQIIFRHIPREQNKDADALVNQALDAALA